MVAPDRSLDQRRTALVYANEVRAERAARKRAWKKMSRTEAADSLATLMMDPPPWAQAWKILEALGALPRMGPIAATRIRSMARASDTKTIGGLSERQRSEIADALEVWTWGKRHDRCPECAGQMAATSMRCLACCRRAA